MTPGHHIQARFRLHYTQHTPAALDVDLCLSGRGITAIFGPSGAGKTTLLRCISGLERAPGRLQVNDQIWQDEDHWRPTHRRPLGYVFQEASLFPHLDVKGNLDYAARRAGRDRQTWTHVTELMGLQHLLERRPEQLSGGERQRVAIARALLIRPQLLLMDEPLAGLDAARKQEIFPYLERLHAEAEVPILYVSHSLDEVARLADHLVVLQGGRIQDQGPAAETLARLDVPAGEEAGVILDTTVIERDPHWQLARLQFDGGQLWVTDGGQELGQALRVRVLARDISLSRDEQTHSSILNRLPATIADITEAPGHAQAMVRLQLDNTTLLARLTRRSIAELELAVGQPIWAQIKSVAVIR